jgi:hypothetical protein
MMSSAAQPARQTKVEHSITQLRTALLEASETNHMPAPRGGVLGGGWQWLWYASANPDQAYRIDVSAEPSAEGVTVSGHSLTWNRRGDRNPAGKTWFLHFYSHEESQHERLMEDLTEPLLQAWQSAVAASGPGLDA